MQAFLCYTYFILKIAGEMRMDEFIKMPDENLDYLGHEILGDTVIIYVASNRKEM